MYGPESDADALSSLIERSRVGDREAFGELTVRFQARVHFIALKALDGHHEDAQDLTQDVFIQAFRQIGQLQDPLAFFAWLRIMTTRMAINVCTRNKSRRRECQHQEIDKDIFVNKNDRPTPDSLIANEERARIHAALDSLGEMDRRALELFHLQDNSLREMKIILSKEEGRQIPMGTIKRRLHNARRRLGRELETDAA